MSDSGEEEEASLASASDDDESVSDYDEPVKKKAKKTSEKAPRKKPQPTAPKKKAPAAKKSKSNAIATDKNGVRSENGDEDPMDVFLDIDKATDHGKKRLSIERIYQKKSQLEHILLRPDTYIGSVENTDRAPMWVYDSEQDKIVLREISYVPGLYKIFDEVLVNAADNKQRDPSMNTIKINIDRDKNEISVWNNGKGIPVVEHKVEKVFVPELIFGTLLTSSNYDDSQKKVTGGRNGYGAKLCNIFSSKFTVETSCKEYKRAFKQSWTNNMQNAGEAKVTTATGEDYTKVTFVPDLAKFKMTELNDDIVALLSRRAFDVAGSLNGVKVFLNGKRLPVVGFKQYVEQYVSGRTDDNGEPLKVVFDQVNKRWEVAVTVSDKGFQQVSFANSIATTKGGRHVDYVADQITGKLIETIKKKVNKSGVQVKPFQVKTHMWVFVNALIENPTFDSQTKETMTLQAKNFGSKCDLSDKFINNVAKCGIVESVLSWVRFKQQEVLDKKCSGKKTSKLKGVAKLEDANDAGTKNSSLCTLILTEGDSAKTLAVSGLGVVGRDRYGVFPLRGKMLNVREGNHKQIMENAEINALIKILGLQYKRKYESEDDLKTLRYGKVMVMADQDQDGSHIKGLLINFIHFNWPSLIKRNFVEEFITPIVKAIKGKEEIAFFSIPEYTEWKRNTDNWQTYRVKYYKGLGTSTSKEAKEYFTDMARHRIKFKYGGQMDDNAVELAFSKKKIEERKDWLTAWMAPNIALIQERKRRREEGLPEEFLYNKDTKTITLSDFVNKELVLFSNTDNERSLPSLVDGLKPGQRKVLFTCFKRADKREVKVAQLAGAVGEMSAYHHGEASLMSTIVNLAQDFVGSNNINLLLPIGQFGTRLLGGKDSASPRYIFTMLNPVTRALFPPADDNVLRFLFEENQRIEPEWYCPILPMVLVNGADGIGTAWSTKIPNYNPREIVENLQRLIRDEPMKPMQPWFKNFRGTIQPLDATRFVCNGEVSVIDEETIEITELPIRTWTVNYKESVLEPMLDGTEKCPALITDYKEYNTDQTVKFVVRMNAAKLRDAEKKGLHSVFKLQSIINTTSMVLFDADGCLRKFERVEEIMEEFFRTRRRKYHERKKFLEGILLAQSSRLSNQARFILEKIKGDIVLENKKKSAIVAKLIERHYDPDPVKKWKETQRKLELADTGDAEDDEVQSDEDASDARTRDLETKLNDFDYLVGMALIKLSEEEKDKLLRESAAKQAEHLALQGKTWADLWNEDLKNFIIELDKQEEKERSDSQQALKGGVKKQGKDKDGGGRPRKAAPILSEVMPSPKGDRVVPRIDAAMKQRYEKADQMKACGVVGGAAGRKRKEVGGALTGAGASDENLSLLDRVLAKSPARKELHQRLSLEDGKTTTKFLTTIKEPKKNKEKTDKTKPAKKTTKKKKEEWKSDESSEASEDEEFDQPDFDDSDEEKEVMPKSTTRRRKIVSDDDENESDGCIKEVDNDELMLHDGASRDAMSNNNDSDSRPSASRLSGDDATFKDGNSDAIALGESSKDAEGDDQPVKAKPTAASRRPQKTVAKGSKKAAKGTAKKRKAASSDDDDDGESDGSKKATKSKPNSKKGQIKNIRIDSDEDSDDAVATEAKSLNGKAETATTSGRAGRNRAPVKYNFDEFDDDSDKSDSGEKTQKVSEFNIEESD